MRLALLFGAVATLGTSIPAYACEKVTPTVRAWAQCSYKAAYKTTDHKFMVNFARAKWGNKKLLPNAQARWNKLEPRIVAACGTFARAAAQDRKNFEKIKKTTSNSLYLPDNQFEAIGNTYDIDILVN